MAKTRLKAPAQPAPQSRDEADTLLGEIGALQRELDRISQDLTDEIAVRTEAAKALAAPIAESIKGKFKAITTWAAANRSEILPKGRRSVTLAHGVIGWRMGSPAVKVSKGQEDAVMATLEQLGLARFLRRTTELDREAILRDVDAIATVPGIKVEQAESFFAKPLDVEVEQVATVLKLTGAEIRPRIEEATDA